jgi:hypothetical protein
VVYVEGHSRGLGATVDALKAIALEDLEALAFLDGLAEGAHVGALDISHVGVLVCCRRSVQPTSERPRWGAEARTRTT